MEEQCKMLQQKLDLLLQTLCKEESYLAEHGGDLDNITLNTEESVSPDICEKGVLEKPEKDITNLKRVQRTRFIEKEIVMSRYIAQLIVQRYSKHW